MKLNKQHKETFVEKVMADIPMKDYKTEYEAKLKAYVLSKLPKLVAECYNDPVARLFMSYGSYSPSEFRCMGSVSMPKNWGYDFVYSDEFMDELRVLHDAYAKYRDDRIEAENTLTAAIAACSTLKQAKEQLPEFIKCLPDEANPQSMLPATIPQDLVNKMKAFGLPIGENSETI